MRLLLPLVLIVAIVGFAVSIYFPKVENDPPSQTSSTDSPAISGSSTAEYLSAISAASSSTVVDTTPKKPETLKPAKKPAAAPVNTEPVTPTATTSEASKAPSPYSTAPESFDEIAVGTRAALVNILCMPQSGSLKPISGSGVLISPAGVILTNAHVAQYVLLSEDRRIDLSCVIKTGTPAKSEWRAAVLYIPPVWVNTHHTELNQDRVSGTGEHDYALLKITGDMQGNPVNEPLPYLPIETRENVAFEGDPVLVAGYPAELVGGILTQQGLYAALSPSTIKKLMTFGSGSVDVLSVGGVLVAQGGASGGPVVNAWRHVVSIIVTTSEGATTAERDLHSLNLNYIARDFADQTGQTLESLLNSDLTYELNVFTRNTAPGLIRKYIDFLRS